jgi:site-specific DNA-methyltransferase (adenine-specific)/modification methylase
MSEAATKEETVIQLDPREVKRGWRARADYGDVEGLTDSIKSLGQLQPILVKWNKKKECYFLIAGNRRLNACKKLDRKVSAIVIKPKDELQNLTIQLSENIQRKDFDQLEIAEGMARYKAVYEKKFPETKLGADLKKGSKEAKKHAKRAEKFVAKAAKVLGVGERSVYELLEVADLPDEDKEEANKAKTTAERNKKVQEAKRKARTKRKEEKLKVKAEEKRKKAKKAEKKGAKVKAKDVKMPEAGKELILYQGDMRKVVKHIPDGSIGLVFTDPPYGRKHSVLSHMTRKDIHEKIDWDDLDTGWVRKVARKLVDGGTIVVFCPAEEVGAYEYAFKKCKIDYRGCFVWHKTNPVPAHREAYAPSCEFVVWGVRKGNDQTFTPFENAGKLEAHNFVEGPICGGAEKMDHPTQKPLWLIKRLLLQHSAEGDRVLDPFCGVATTLVACKEEKREGIGIEKKKAYVKQGKLRLGATDEAEDKPKKKKKDKEGKKKKKGKEGKKTKKGKPKDKKKGGKKKKKSDGKEDDS